jgi:uncharacterized protein
VSRYLVLFAREPRREALAKGFGAPGEDLFVAFARGWLEVARRTGARFVIAAPPEDRAGWGKRLPESSQALWIVQSGCSFGERLEAVARRASRLPGPAILVGGDVVPSERAAAQAFVALDSGAEAVLGPSDDGGVSLLALGAEDSDLLRAVGPRQRRVVERLRRGLQDRGRSIAWVGAAPDIDGLSSLAAFERGLAPCPTRTLARRILGLVAATPPLVDRPRESVLLAAAAGPRAPPAPA